MRNSNLNIIKSFIVKQIDINTNFIHWSNAIKIEDFLEFLIEIEDNNFLKKYIIFLKKELEDSKNNIDFNKVKDEINDLINYYYFYLNTNINNNISVNDFIINIKEFLRNNYNINSINSIFLKTIKAIDSMNFGSQTYYKNPNEKEDLEVLEKIKNLIKNCFYKDKKMNLELFSESTIKNLYEVSVKEGSLLNINGELYRKVLDEDKILNLKRKSIFKFADKI